MIRESPYSNDMHHCDASQVLCIFTSCLIHSKIVGLPGQTISTVICNFLSDQITVYCVCVPMFIIMVSILSVHMIDDSPIACQQIRQYHKLSK